jgi:hypothetical protein
MEIAFIVAYALMALGLLGAILPLLPGAPLIWLGALVWTWADKFRHFGWGTLIVLAVLAMLSFGLDMIITTTASRRAGAGWRGIAAAIVGGLVGAVLLGGVVPILGAIVGTIVGASTGLFAMEYYVKRDPGAAGRAACGYIAGYLVASIVQALVCLLLIAIFIVRAFL